MLIKVKAEKNKKNKWHFESFEKTEKYKEENLWSHNSGTPSTLLLPFSLFSKHMCTHSDVHVSYFTLLLSFCIDVHFAFFKMFFHILFFILVFSLHIFSFWLVLFNVCLIPGSLLVLTFTWIKIRVLRRF